MIKNTSIFYHFAVLSFSPLLILYFMHHLRTLCDIIFVQFTIIKVLREPQNSFLSFMLVTSVCNVPVYLS